MSQVKKPTWLVDVAVRVGEAALKLSMDHRAVLDSRLPAGTIDRLGADLAVLRDMAAGASVARATKSSATLTQKEACRAGLHLVAAIRSAVRDARPADKALHKAFGVGVRVKDKKVSSVEAALQTILDAAAREPEAAAEVGLRPEDVEEVRLAKAALGAADTSQEVKKVSAKAATSDRDGAHLRVEALVRRIIGASRLAFRGQPAVARMFADLVPASRGSAPAARATA